MNWIEDIKFQTANSDLESIIDHVDGLISSIHRYGGLKEVKLFRNASVQNQMQIYLYWSSVKPQAQGSAAGQCLVHLLKEFGLTDHSVWIEEV